MHILYIYIYIYIYMPHVLAPALSGDHPAEGGIVVVTVAVVSVCCSCDIFWRKLKRADLFVRTI